MTSQTLNRRANSLPALGQECLAGSPPDENALRSELPGAFEATSTFPDSRSPTHLTTFSPVFELELGGTPQEPHDGRRSRQGRATPAPIPFGLMPSVLHAAASRQQLVQKAAAGAATVPGLDRSQSDLQVMLGLHSSSKNAGQQGPEALSPAEERLMELCKPANDLELELSRRLRAFRNARIAKPHISVAASGALAANQPLSVDTSASSATPSGPTPGEIEALASELLSDCFLVQILDGKRLSKDVRACLRTLKHRFLVCLGRGKVPSRRSLSGGGQDRASCWHAGARPGPALAAHASQLCPQLAQQHQQRLNEPLVVEVRFREQFLIASPSRDYERLLLALPVVFVGPLQRLDAVVELMAREVASVFRQAHRPLPPWRTKNAMLSKWAPSQLLDMQRCMQQAAEEEVEAEPSWGSGLMDITANGVDTALSEPLACRVPQGLVDGDLALAQDEQQYGPSCLFAAASEEDGHLAPRSTSAPLHLMHTPLAAAAAAGRLHVRDPGDPMLSTDQLLCDAQVSLSQVDLPDADVILMDLCSGLKAQNGADGGSEADGLTFPVLKVASMTGPVYPLAPIPAPQQEQVHLAAPSVALEQGEVQQQHQQPQNEQQMQQGLTVNISRGPQQHQRSLFSPFACVSMPEACDGDDDSGSSNVLENRPVPCPSAEMPRVPACTICAAGNRRDDHNDNDGLLEFTLMHSTLETDSRQDGDLGPQHGAGAAGRLHRGSTMPLSTPSHAGRNAPAACQVDGTGMVRESGLTTARTETTVVVHAHQPLAAGALRGFGGAGPAAAAGAPVNGSLALTPRSDIFRITRRSSSDLSRAASKFKNAKSALAAALRRATGAASKDGVDKTAAGASGSGTGSQQQQQAAHRDGAVRDSRAVSGGETALAAGGVNETASAGGSCRVTTTPGAGAAQRGDCTQVALAGGVMTRPAGDEPAWARIATVRWGGQPAAPQG